MNLKTTESSLRLRLPSKRWAIVGLTSVIVLLAAVLRVVSLDEVPLRGDEAYAVLNWSVTPFSEPWWGFVSREPHPAGALLLYGLWTRLGGISELAVRLLPAWSGVLGVALVMRLTLDLTRNRRAMLWAGALWAFNPFLVYHAQDARTLSTLSALSVLNLLLLLRALRGGRGAPVAYVIAQSATLYVSYVEGFGLAAQMALVVGGVWAGAWGWGRVRYAVVRLWLPVGLLCIPVGLMLLNFLVNSGFETHSTGFDLGVLLGVYLPSLWFGSVPPMLAAPVLALGALAIAWGVRGAPRRVALLGAGVPLGMFTVASVASAGFFLPGYLIAMVAPLTVGWGALAARRRGAWLTSVLLLVMLVGLGRYWLIDPPKAPDWRGIAAHVGQSGERGVLVLGTPDTAAEYYVSTPLYLMPPSTSDFSADFARLLAEYDVIYVSGDQRAQAARDFFEANAQRINDRRPHNLTQYRPPTVRETEISRPLTVGFGGVARLRGWSVADGALLLYWEALGQTATPYSILTHLTPGVLDASAPVSSFDHGPLSGRVSTTEWLIGQTYRDDVRLPDDLPSGWYTVWVGLYDGATGTGLPPAPRVALGVFYQP